jgi:hypothetical protein
MASVEGKVLGPASSMRVGCMVGAVNLILDAEVVELVQHIVSPISELPQLV